VNYLERANDLIKAVRSLRRSGASVSLPHQTANGKTFFEIDGVVLTVNQILELFDKKKLDRVGIQQFSAKEVDFE
jgi:hypothetical protein